MTIFQANLRSILKPSKPDDYDLASGKIPPDDFVVTRNKDGSVLSKFGELRWDRTPYHTRSKPINLYFDYWSRGKRPRATIHSDKEKLGWDQRRDDVTPERVEIVRETQWLMFILLYLKPGAPFSNQTLVGYNLLFLCLARIAEINKKKVSEVLSCAPLLLEGVLDHYKVQLVPFLKLLKSLGSNIVGFEVTLEKKDVARLAAEAGAWKHSCNQTPPIPTRIYSLILTALSHELDEFESVTDRILALYGALAKDPLLGKNNAAQIKICLKLKLNRGSIEKNFKEMLQLFDLEHFWEKRGYPKTYLSLTSVIIDIFTVAAMQIQAFSGMRRNELEELPYDCLEEVWRKEDEKIHYIICGRVTKLTGGKIKRVQWVTSDSGRRAILIAQRFSAAIYAGAEVFPKNEGESINSYPLFITPRFGLRKNRKYRGISINILPERLERRLLPLIEEEDLRELEFIDLDRDWRNEDSFQVGKLWPLASHQFRRSLALYAQASGLVSLPSLKRQLQHITREMALYYARGSEFAKNFIGDLNGEKHIGKEWQEAQPVSQYLAYAASVLMADKSELFGTHGQFVNTRLRNDEGVVLIDRAATLQHFEKGEMAYRETLLGGCTKVGVCDKNPLDLFHVECVTNHCKNMVGNRKKLERAIRVQRNFVSRLAVGDALTPEYRHEKVNLEILLEVQNNHFPEKTP